MSTSLQVGRPPPLTPASHSTSFNLAVSHLNTLAGVRLEVLQFYSWCRLVVQFPAELYLESWQIACNWQQHKVLCDQQQPG